MKKTCFIILNILLVCAMVLTACAKSPSGSGNTAGTTDAPGSGNTAGVVEKCSLMKGITANKVTASDDLSSQTPAVSDFAVRLFKECCKDGSNTLISPLSVMFALSMTANGADGETLSQMENVLGMGIDELNMYLYSYMNSLPKSEKYKLSPANSIWFKDTEGLSINRDFLQTNADYYKADIYKVPFDKQTLKDINGWVKDKTDGMIPEILDKIPQDAIMYLINALAFEAEWEEIYKENLVWDGVFTKEDGTEQNAEFMYSGESNYLEDKNAKGFIKYYSGRKYAFAAMLPDEGTSLSEYISSLNGETLHKLLSNPKQADIEAAIPKFETKYSAEMSDILAGMGMPRAFDGSNAEFKKMGTSSAGNIFIGRVIHKTHISVMEKGTKAGAATVVEMWDEGMEAGQEEPKVIHLDRPFVYMLIDCENNMPFFIGTMTDIEG